MSEIHYSNPELKAAVDRIKAELVAEGIDVPRAYDVAPRLPQRLVATFWNDALDAVLGGLQLGAGIRPEPDHFHTDAPLVQCGWLGQSGRYYPLGDKVDEPGGYSPVYRHWGEKCGHQIATEGAQEDQ